MSGSRRRTFVRPIASRLYVARRSRAPYLRRWAPLIALARLRGASGAVLSDWEKSARSRSALSSGWPLKIVASWSASLMGPCSERNLTIAATCVGSRPGNSSNSCALARLTLTLVVIGLSLDGQMAAFSTRASPVGSWQPARPRPAACRHRPREAFWHPARCRRPGAHGRLHDVGMVEGRGNRINAKWDTNTLSIPARVFRDLAVLAAPCWL